MSVGGLFYSKPQTEDTYPDEIDLSLISDPHIGSAYTDYGFLQQELERAKSMKTRILLNGDVVDAIFPKDKRFTPDVVHPRIRGRRDMVNALRDWAIELLAPYASQIDLIGLGNHETHLEKHQNYDIVRDIVKGLSDIAGREIAYGGYTGIVEYRLASPRKVSGVPYVIFYHHGTGKSSAVRSAAENLQKKASWAVADLYWQGHAHCRFTSVEEVVGVTPTGKLQHREVRYIVTGAYVRPYQQQTAKSFHRHGRKSLYPSDAGLTPHGVGGARISLWTHKGKVHSQVTL